jgi:hypothetical protein
MNQKIDPLRRFDTRNLRVRLESQAPVDEVALSFTLADCSHAHRSQRTHSRYEPPAPAPAGMTSLRWMGVDAVPKKLSSRAPKRSTRRSTMRCVAGIRAPPVERFRDRRVSRHMLHRGPRVRCGHTRRRRASRSTLGLLDKRDGGHRGMPREHRGQATEPTKSADWINLRPVLPLPPRQAASLDTRRPTQRAAQDAPKQAVSGAHRCAPLTPVRSAE